MKRLQILIDEELDTELERVASSSGRSKSALIRDFVRQHLAPLPPLDQDPFFKLAGRAAFDPAPIDEVVYGRPKRGKRRSRP
jgi:hypothetical protein